MKLQISFLLDVAGTDADGHEITDFASVPNFRESVIEAIHDGIRDAMQLKIPAKQTTITLKATAYRPTPSTMEGNQPLPDGPMAEALQAFVNTINATGGLLEKDDVNVPAADEDWLDLADAYLLACKALGVEPMAGEEANDDVVTDG